MENENRFIREPFQPLGIHPAQYDPDGAMSTYFEISNAIDHYLQLSLANRKKLIDLGSKKAEGYNIVNSERYDLDAKMASLTNKKDSLEQLFYTKNAELKSLGKDRKFLPRQ